MIKIKMSLALIRVGLAACAKTHCSEFQRDPCLDLDLDLPLPVCLVGKSIEQKGNNNLAMPGEGP